MDFSFLSQTKIYGHLDRIEGWLRTGICFPVTIEIDPTNVCTRNCAACAGNKFRDGQLPLRFMRKIIDQIKPFCRGLIFTGGGEPLCNADTLAAVEYAKKSGIDVALVTNADLINEAIAKKIVKNCAYVRVSCNDDNIWDRVKLLVDTRNRGKGDCTIGIGMLTNKKRRSLMRDFASKAKRVKVDYAQFRPYHLNTFDARALIKKIQSDFNGKNFRVIASEYKYEDMEKRKKKIKSYAVSLADNFRTVIAADGKLYPDCFTRGMESFCLGDLKKDSFKKIWKSGRRKRILLTRLDNKDCPPMCYHDPLNELLWHIWRQNREGKHMNFV